MAEHIFSCKGTGTEYPARFDGAEVRYNIAEPVNGDPHATLDAFLEQYVEPGTSPEDQATIVADLFNGYGLTYRRNGIVKRVLASDDVKDLPVEEALAKATEAVNADRLGAPKQSSGGGRKSKAVAAAEAERDAAKDMARTMFLSMNASLRKQLRPQLVEKFGEEQVAGWEAEG